MIIVDRFDLFVFTVRSAVRRGVQSEGVYVPRSAHSAHAVQQRDQQSLSKIEPERVELRRRGDRQLQRENQVNTLPNLFS